MYRPAYLQARSRGNNLTRRLAILAGIRTITLTKPFIGLVAPLYTTDVPISLTLC